MRVVWWDPERRDQRLSPHCTCTSRQCHDEEILDRDHDNNHRGHWTRSGCVRERQSKKANTQTWSHLCAEGGRGGWEWFSDWDRQPDPDHQTATKWYSGAGHMVSSKGVGGLEHLKCLIALKPSYLYWALSMNEFVWPEQWSFLQAMQYQCFGQTVPLLLMRLFGINHRWQYFCQF